MIELFKRLFGKRRPPNLNIATAPLPEEQLEVSLHKPAPYQPPQLISGSAQSVGRQREHNEDALFSLSATFADGSSDLPLGIFIIADGMGGHQHGEVASGVAARTMAEYLVKKLYPPLLGAKGEAQAESLQEIMENGVKEAQQAVVRKAPGGGTTLTAALVVGEQVTIAHVGDSRGYFIYPDGRLQILTQDHSLVHRLVELGQLTEDEAAVHPQRNVLYRALGQSEPFHPDIHSHKFPVPGYLLLCSDGLWNVLTEQQIVRIVFTSNDLPMACRRLVEASNAAGGPDNISAILVQYLA